MRTRLVAALLLCAGCRNFGKPDARYDGLEAELRTRTRELEQTRLERDQLRQLAEVYARQPRPAPQAPFAYGASQHPAPAVPLKEVVLGTGTGGVDEDSLPGDESLMVVVVPKDDDGTAVKVPGRLTVSVSEVSPQGLKTPIGRWEIAADKLKPTWRGGLLGSGYFVPLRWDTAPGAGRVRVTVQFVSLDGQPYEADKDVTVKPLAGVGPAPAVPDRPPPPGAEELPPPARLLPARVEG
jgi:hypothetical protein